MKSPFEKKFCGKSPLKELTAKQEANLPEALKTAIEASPNNYGSPLEQSFGEPKLSVMNQKKVKTENWSDNPIPEAEKRKHPDYKRAMKNIEAFNKKIGTEGSTKFYRDSLETPVIKHKGKNYPLIALVSD
jgi:hypothetical protein